LLNDRIRLIGLLRKSPASVGLFYVAISRELVTLDVTKGTSAIYV